MSNHWGDILPERQKRPSIVRSLYEYSMASISILVAGYILGWCLWQLSQMDWYPPSHRTACIIVTNGQVCGPAIEE